MWNSHAMRFGRVGLTVTFLGRRLSDIPITMWTCRTLLQGRDSFNVSSYAESVRSAKNTAHVPCSRGRHGTLHSPLHRTARIFQAHCEQLIWSWHMKHGFAAEHNQTRNRHHRYFPTVSAQNVAQLASPGLGCYKTWSREHSNFKCFLTIFLVGGETPTPQLARLAGFRGRSTIASRTLSTAASFRLPSLPHQPFLTCAPRIRYHRDRQLGCEKKSTFTNVELKISSSSNSECRQSNLCPLDYENDYYFSKSHCLHFMRLDAFFLYFFRRGP
jgi:hypothetical protein